MRYSTLYYCCFHTHTPALQKDSLWLLGFPGYQVLLRFDEEVTNKAQVLVLVLWQSEITFVIQFMDKMNLFSEIWPFGCKWQKVIYQSICGFFPTLIFFKMDFSWKIFYCSGDLIVLKFIIGHLMKIHPFTRAKIRVFQSFQRTMWKYSLL